MDKGTIIRFIVMFVALINQFLVMNGIETIPFTGDKLEGFLTGAFTVVATFIAYFKNNYITGKGKQQKEVLKQRGLTKAK